MRFAVHGFLALLAICVCAGDFAQGATFARPAPENPAYPDKCYDSKLKQAVAVGASVTDHSDCTRLRCSKSRAKPPTYTISGETCSYAYSLPANCHLIAGNPSANFPDCCSKVHCDGAPQGSVRVNG